MSHKKAGGSTQNNRDSNAQRLGIKLHDGQTALPGMIIVRQRGTKIHPGKNVKRSGDDSLFALAAGVVKFKLRKRLRFDGTRAWTKFVEIVKA